MDYKKGDFLLIKDKEYKAKNFIGEIQKKIEKNKYLLYVYIFPEDTIDGKQSYMSVNEVFLTPTLKTCFLDGTKEEKVEVVSLEQYINRKYGNIDEKCGPLYFKRQSYIIEKDIFIPEELPRICYCHQIFNPDIPFSFISSGYIVHDECKMQAKQDISFFDYSSFYDYNSVLLEKSRNQSFFNDINKDKLYEVMEESLMSFLKKKRNMDDDGSPKKTSEKRNEMGKKKSKPSNKKSKDDEEEEEEEEDDDKNKNKDKDKKEDTGDLQKEELLIFETLKEGYDIISKNKILLDKYKEYENNEIYKLIQNDEHDIAILCLRKIATEIREKLKDFYSKSPKDYSLFLKEFKKANEISINLLTKIILVGEIDPDQVLLNLKNNAINPIILSQNMDGTWEANKKNMEDLRIGYIDLNEFKNKNKNILNDELFGNKNIEEIDDSTLMTIIVICYMEKNIKDKENFKIALDKAKDAVKKVVDSFDDKMVEKIIQKIFPEDK